MQYSLDYRLGDTPPATDIREFPDAQTAKDHARESLQETLAASSADAGRLAVGELRNDSAEVTWLGAYSLARGGEPVWQDET
jgi:hypothetical protein